MTRQRGDIVTDAASQDRTRSSRRVVAAGGALLGTGALLGFTGILLLSSAVVSATRRWVSQLEPPPREIARLKWQQARAATTAGVEAWRNGPAAQSQVAPRRQGAALR
jgi:hypothetical protein